MSDILKPPGGGGLPPMGTPGAPEGLPIEPQDQGRERYERGGLPVDGPDIIEKLQYAEVGENGDISELQEAIEEALAFREGLEFGYDGIAYEIDPNDTRDIGNKQRIAYLQAMYTTVEGAMSRPTPTYIDIAIDEAVNGRIRRAQDYQRNRNLTMQKMIAEQRLINKTLIKHGRPELVKGDDEIEEVVRQRTKQLENEYAAIPQLIQVANHTHARRIYDLLFQHRMNRCEDPGGTAEVGIKVSVPTPDGPHWAALFQTETMAETAQAIDVVLEEIIKFGLPDEVIRRIGMTEIPFEVRQMVPSTIYVDGFKSGVIFGQWFNYLYAKSGKRADVVWNAWKLALTTEVIDSISQKVNEKGEYELPTPPIGNSLFTFIAHLPEKRKIEFGIGANGQRTQVEKFVSHSGLPMSLDKIPNLCLDYLHEGKIEFGPESFLEFDDIFRGLLENLPQTGDPDYNIGYEKLRGQIINCWRREIKADGSPVQPTVKVSLWDLRIYGGLKFTDPRFPWFQTDQPNPDAAPGELPGGSMGGWFLKRSRSHEVQQDIRAVHPLQELGKPTFFIERTRNWTKVLGGLKDYDKNNPETWPANNPRAWWLAGQLYYHFGGSGTYRSPIIEQDQTRIFRTPSQNQRLEFKSEGLEQKGVGIGDVLKHAIDSGFIRDADANWIKKQLRINLT